MSHFKNITAIFIKSEWIQLMLIGIFLLIAEQCLASTINLSLTTPPLPWLLKTLEFLFLIGSVIAVYKFSFEKFIKLFFISLIVFSICLMPLTFIGSLCPKSINHIFVTFLASILNFLPRIIPILYWGISNQNTSFKEGLLYYIPLWLVWKILVGCGISVLINGPLFSLTMSTINRVTLLNGLTLIFLLLAYVSFKKIKSPQSSISHTSKFSIFALACLLAIPVIVLSISEYSVKTNLFQAISHFEKSVQIEQYANFFKRVMYVFFGTSTLWLFIGGWLLKHKGWAYTAFSILGASIIIFGISIYLKNPALFIGYLKANLLFPVVQIIYLTIGLDLRLKSKIWAELIIAPYLVKLFVPIFPILFFTTKFAYPALLLIFILMLAFIIQKSRKQKTLLK